MLRRWSLILTALQLLVSHTSSGMEQINPDEIKVLLKEPQIKPGGSLKTSIKAKTKVVVKLEQPAKVQQPDYILIVLAKDNNDFSEWFAKQNAKDTSSYECSFIMPSVKGSIELYAIAVYSEPSIIPGRHTNTIRVKSERIKVEVKQ